eukprot:TRINITY_DN3740_c0_g1_i1.p1 TRINITY_DN3740_c0_g1~~TRINITY_DN3740_c0_g1_i1.p1  ORF type:complete len:1448 (-),score=432.40 TRINITY_DN3740_c0_g1_i1:485-4828(-)
MEKDNQNQNDENNDLFHNIILQSCTNPMICVNYIQKNPHNFTKLLDFIFSMKIYKNEIWQILIFLMLEQNPGNFMKLLKEKGVGSSVCGRQWKGNQHDICYHCKDCESDPSCAICEDCFEPEKHEGHDYRIVKAGGGCCDCGDDQAWNPEGFCKKHSGNIGELNLESILPKNVIESSQKVINRLLFWMVRNIKLSILDVKEFVQYNSKLSGMIKFIETFCKSFGDPFKRLLALQLREEFISQTELNKIIKEDQSESMKLSPFEYLFITDNKIHSVIQKSFHNLYFILLGDTEFKKNFAFLFSKYYSILYEESKEKEKWPQSLLHFAVQIFTVLNLAPQLCTTYHAFTNVINTIEKVFKHCQVESKDNKDKRPILDTSLPVYTTSHIYSTITDFGYLVLQQPVSSVLLQQKSDLKLYLSVVEMFQGSLLLKRKQGEHVLFDSTSQYNDTFGLEIDFIGKYSSNIFKSLIPENNLVDENFKSKLFYVSSKIISAFKRYSSKISWEWSKKTKEKPKMLIYVPEKNFVTPFFPLQKLLSIFISNSLSRHSDSDISLNDFFKDVEIETIHEMFQELVNFYVFKYQAEAKLWVRNGQIAEIMASAYQLKWNHFYSIDSDIFFYQMSTILIGQETFISILFENFQINDWKLYLTNTKKPERNSTFHPDVVASSLKLVSTILTDRNAYLSSDEILEKEIIHFLFALEPISFSKLSKAVNDSISKNKNFENVLNKVATKKKGEGNEILFLVKPIYWTKYDRFFAHYDRVQAQKAEENYTEQMKKKKDNVPLPFPKIKPLLASLSELKAIAQSLQVHQIILLALQNYSSEYNNEKTLSEILCLLYICVEYAFEEVNKNSLNILQDMKDPEHESSAILNHLWTIRCDEKQQYQHSSVDVILNQLSDDEDIKQSINKLKKNTNGSSQVSEEDKKELQKQKAKERQQKLMEKMKKQQNKFASSKEATKLDKNEKIDNKDNNVDGKEEEEEKCVLCMEAQNDVEKNPLCYITAFLSTNSCHQLRRRNLSTTLNVGAKLVEQKEEEHFFSIESDISQESKRQKFSLSSSFNEDLSDNSLKIDVEPSKNTFVEREHLYSELNRSIEETESLYMKTCGHTIHYKCYQSYLEKIIREESEHPTLEGINLDKGQFICPLCKSIGSIVAPFHPDHKNPSNKINTEELSFENWFSKFLVRSEKDSKVNLSPKIPSDSEWSLAYDNFLQNVNLNQTSLWPHPSAPLERILSILWNSIAYTISANEMSLRGKENTQFPTVKFREFQHFNYLTKLASSLISNREDKRVVSCEALKYLWNIVTTTNKTRDLLRFDSFSFLVRLMFSYSVINGNFDFQHKNYYYQLFFQMNVIQQIYTVYNYATTLFNLSPSYKASWKKKAMEFPSNKNVSNLEELSLYIVQSIEKRKTNSGNNSGKNEKNMEDEISEEFNVSKLEPVLHFLSLSFFEKSGFV